MQMQDYAALMVVFCSRFDFALARVFGPSYGLLATINLGSSRHHTSIISVSETGSGVTFEMWCRSMTTQAMQCQRVLV